MGVTEVHDEACGDEGPTMPDGNQSGSLTRQTDIVVTRPIFNQNRFDHLQEGGEHLKPLTPWKKFKRDIRQRGNEIRYWHPTVRSLTVGIITGIFPILKWLPQYPVKKYLPTDLLSGFLVAIMSIPSGMAYSLLASIPAIYGLYTSFFPSLIYSMMATSKHVSIGVFAIISIMTGKLVQQYALPNTGVALLSSNNFTAAGGGSVTSSQDSDVYSHLDARMRVVVCVTVAVGIWQLVIEVEDFFANFKSRVTVKRVVFLQLIMGLLGLGYLTVYLSDQLVTGPIFGLRAMKDFNGPFKIIFTWVEFIRVINTTHFATLIVATICINFLIAIKYLINTNKWTQKRLPCHVHVPGELFVVIFGSLASFYMDLGPKYGVDIVGTLPLGLPAPQLPDFSILPAFFVDTFAIAIVSFAITLSLGKMYSIKHKYDMNSNQELRALGCSNIFAGFFQCVPSTGFLGRVTAQASVGGATQIVSLLSAGIILIVLLFLGHFLEPLPKCCLGSIIIVALIGMLKEVSQVCRLGKVSSVDASVFLVAILAVVILDVDIGLGVAVGWSLLTIVFRTQRPDVAVLGRALHTDIYRRTDDYKSVTEVAGCKIISFSAPLYFANSDYFIQRVRSIAKINRSPVDTKIKSKTTHAVPNHSAPDPTVHSPETARSILLANLPHLSQTPSYSITANHDEPSNGGTVRIDAGTWTADYFDQPIKYLIIDCSGMCFIDINGAQAIKDLAEQCSSVGTTLFITSCKSEMKEMLALAGYTRHINAEHIFMHVHDAVMQAVRENEEVKSRKRLTSKSPIDLTSEKHLTCVDEVTLAETAVTDRDTPRSMTSSTQTLSFPNRMV